MSKHDERLYYVVAEAIDSRTGVSKGRGQIRMHDEPLSHVRATTMMRKFSAHPGRRIMLVEADKANPKRARRNAGVRYVLGRVHGAPAHRAWAVYDNVALRFAERERDATDKAAARARAAAMNAADGNGGARRNAGKLPTYEVAQTALFNALGQEGWKLSSPSLKIRHATTPDGWFRYWFKPRVAYYTVLTGMHDRHDFGEARTMAYDYDPRTLRVDTLIRMAESALKRHRPNGELATAATSRRSNAGAWWAHNTSSYLTGLKLSTGPFSSAAAAKRYLLDLDRHTRFERDNDGVSWVSDQGHWVNQKPPGPDRKVFPPPRGNPASSPRSNHHLRVGQRVLYVPTQARGVVRKAHAGDLYDVRWDGGSGTQNVVGALLQAE